MIKSPLIFFEVEDKYIIGESIEFGEPSFGKTPETFNAINMRFSACKLILRMVHAVVIISVQNKSVIDYGASFQDSSLNNGQECLFKTVFDNGYMDFFSSL